jgi:hypothetical protein
VLIHAGLTSARVEDLGKMFITKMLCGDLAPKFGRTCTQSATRYRRPSHRISGLALYQKLHNLMF